MRIPVTQPQLQSQPKPYPQELTQPPKSDGKVPEHRMTILEIMTSARGGNAEPSSVVEVSYEPQSSRPEPTSHQQKSHDTKIALSEGEAVKTDDDDDGDGGEDIEKWGEDDGEDIIMREKPLADEAALAVAIQASKEEHKEQSRPGQEVLSVESERADLPEGFGLGLDRPGILVVPDSLKASSAQQELKSGVNGANKDLEQKHQKSKPKNPLVSRRSDAKRDFQAVSQVQSAHPNTRLNPGPMSMSSTMAAALQHEEFIIDMSQGHLPDLDAALIYFLFGITPLHENTSKNTARWRKGFLKKIKRNGFIDAIITNFLFLPDSQGQSINVEVLSNDRGRDYYTFVKSITRLIGEVIWEPVVDESIPEIMSINLAKRIALIRGSAPNPDHITQEAYNWIQPDCFRHRVDGADLITMKAMILDELLYLLCTALSSAFGLITLSLYHTCLQKNSNKSFFVNWIRKFFDNSVNAALFLTYAILTNRTSYTDIAFYLFLGAVISKPVVMYLLNQLSEMAILAGSIGLQPSRKALVQLLNKKARLCGKEVPRCASIIVGVICLPISLGLPSLSIAYFLGAIGYALRGTKYFYNGAVSLFPALVDSAFECKPQSVRHTIGAVVRGSIYIVPLLYLSTIYVDIPGVNHSLHHLQPLVDPFFYPSQAHSFLDWYVGCLTVGALSGAYLLTVGLVATGFNRFVNFRYENRVVPAPQNPPRVNPPPVNQSQVNQSRGRSLSYGTLPHQSQVAKSGSVTAPSPAIVSTVPGHKRKVTRSQSMIDIGDSSRPDSAAKGPGLFSIASESRSQQSYDPHSSHHHSRDKRGGEVIDGPDRPNQERLAVDLDAVRQQLKLALTQQG